MRKLLHGKINSIATAALLVAFSSLLSRILGVLRDRILASSFGAGDELDIYYAAFRLPDMTFNLLVLGALSAGFIPVFAKKIKDEKESQDESWLLANNVLSIIGLSMIIIASMAIFFARPLMSTFTPGFSGEKLTAAITLSRIMFLSPILLGLSSIAGAILQSYKRFFIYSLSPIFYNIGIIIGALYLVPLWGISGLAWGVVLGALLHFLIQLPTLRELGYRFKFYIDLRSKDIRKIGNMMVPRTLALGISQIDLMVSTAIASTLTAGSLAVFNFANNLQFFPIGIFGISFATAAFPFFVQHSNEPKKMIEHFSKVFRQILFFIVPSTILFLVLRAQIIRIILGSGAFDWRATVLTMNTLGFFAISLFAQATIPLLVRMFYAREDSKRPFYIGLITVLFDIIMAIKFAAIWGVAGIALAYSIANIINFILLWLVLHHDLGSLDEIEILKATLKFCIAGLIAGFAAQVTKTEIGTILSLTTFTEVLVQGFISATIGITTYFLISIILKSKEAIGILTKIKQRLNWPEVAQTDQGEARGI